jgi:hypothetical protein
MVRQSTSGADAAMALDVEGLTILNLEVRMAKHVRSTDPRKPRIVAALRIVGGGTKVTNLSEVSDGFEGNVLKYVGARQYEDLGRFKVLHSEVTDVEPGRRVVWMVTGHDITVFDEKTKEEIDMHPSLVAADKHADLRGWVVVNRASFKAKTDPTYGK